MRDRQMAPAGTETRGSAEASACAYHVFRAALVSAAILNTLAVSRHFTANLAHPWPGHVRPPATGPMFVLAMFSGLDGTTTWVTLLAACLVAWVGTLLRPQSAGLLCCGAWLYANLVERAWWTQDGSTQALGILLALLVATAFFPALRVRLPWTDPSFSSRDLLLLAARCQVVLIYGVAALANVQGRLWARGTAPAYILQNLSDGAAWAAPFFLRFAALGTGLGFATSAWQLALVFLGWHRRVRPGLYLTGLALHLAVAATTNQWHFAFTMMLIGTCFLPSRICLAMSERVAPSLLGRRLLGVGAGR